MIPPMHAMGKARYSHMQVLPCVPWLTFGQCGNQHCQVSSAIQRHIISPVFQRFRPEAYLISDGKGK